MSNSHIVGPHLRILAAHAREFANNIGRLKIRGRRECRAREAPAASSAK
jgi:hypothetical protein